MACCICSLQGSKFWIALVVPVCAVFASFSSSGHGVEEFVFITLSSLLLVLLSTLSFYIFYKQKPFMEDDSLLKEPRKDDKVFSSVQEDGVDEVASVQAENETIDESEENAQGFLIRSQDLSSESDHFSSSSSSEYHSSDIEWPYSMRRGLDCSDDSISDEESLIEIAIPSGEFVYTERDDKFNLKFPAAESMFQKSSSLDFLADMNDINEEDNLIEIDINMGSIKCSSFEI